MLIFNCLEALQPCRLNWFFLKLPLKLDVAKGEEPICRKPPDAGKKISSPWQETMILPAPHSLPGIPIYEM